MDSPIQPIKGRGAPGNPPNRFERVHVEHDWEHLEDDDALSESAVPKMATEYYFDDTQSIVSENNSPDIPFRYSVNPYRGCLHGCAYCYARPTHEYLGLSAGIDFESKILVKPQAAALFRQWLARDVHAGEPVMFSGVTDCYQPVERRLKLTRECLRVAHACQQPVWIVTKNALVTRDLDILGPMGRANLARVALSIPTLDAALARVMEPRASTPAARLRAMEQLTAAGVPASVMVAPVIPGLTDFHLPAVLEAAARAGASHAGYVLLRLPHTVRPVFLEWLKQHQPLAYDRVTARIQDTRGGKWYDSQWSQRQRGTGPIADQIQQTFRVFAAKHGLDRKPAPLDSTQFIPPRSPSGQGRLF